MSSLMNIPKRFTHFLRSSETARNIARVFCGDALSKVFLVFFTLMVIRGLSEADYAAFVVFQSLRALFPSLVGNGINSAMIRYGAEYFSHSGRRPMRLYKAVLRLQVLIYLAILIVGLLFARTIAGTFYDRADYEYVLMLGLAGGVGYLLMQMQRSVYQAEERFHLFVAVQWIQALASLLYVCVLAASHRMNFGFVAAGLIAVDLLTGLSLLAGSILRRRVSPDEPRSNGRIRWVLKTVKWLATYGIVLALLSQMDVIMLSRLGTGTELARYGVALKYYTLALMALGAVHAVLLPKFSRLDMQDHRVQRAFVWRWVKLSALVAVPLIIFDLWGQPLFVWLNGGKYGDAFEIWIILSVGVWLGLVASPAVNVLAGRKAFRTMFILGMAGLATAYFGNIFLIPRLGACGTAITTVASNAAINVTSLCLLRWSRLGSAAESAAVLADESLSPVKAAEKP